MRLRSPRLGSPRLGATLCFLGIAVAGLPLSGVAAADNVRTDSPSTSAEPASEAGPTPRNSGTRPSAQTEARRAAANDQPSFGPRRSAAVAVPRPTAAVHPARSSTMVTTTGVAGQQSVGPSASTDSATVPVTAVTAVTPAHFDSAVAVQAVHNFFTTTTNWLAGLPTSPVTEFMQGALLMIRRTFFNEGPAAKPQRAIGPAGGQIAGSVEAIDPDGDQIAYTVTEAPQHGTVAVDQVGNYTYTPDPDFTGIDTFAVSVVDTGWHLNVLAPFLPQLADTDVTVVVGNVPPAYGVGEAWDGYAPPADCGCQQTWTYNALVFTNGRCGNPDSDVHGPWCRLASSPDGRTWSYCSPTSG